MGKKKNSLFFNFDFDFQMPCMRGVPQKIVHQVIAQQLMAEVLRNMKRSNLCDIVMATGFASIFLSSSFLFFSFPFLCLLEKQINTGEIKF